MMQKVPERCEFEAGLRYATTGKLCQPSSKWVPFAKGEGWAPPFISCAQDTVKL